MEPVVIIFLIMAFGLVGSNIVEKRPLSATIKGLLVIAAFLGACWYSLWTLVIAFVFIAIISAFQAGSKQKTDSEILKDINTQQKVQTFILGGSAIIYGAEKANKFLKK